MFKASQRPNILFKIKNDPVKQHISSSIKQTIDSPRGAGGTKAIDPKPALPKIELAFSLLVNNLLIELAFSLLVVVQ